MKFGVREICNVVFKAKAQTKIGGKTFAAGAPVLYIDSAKTSTLEGAATTVYATGGRGNARLIAWEGEKTLTFTVEDALLSPVGLAILSGAGLLNGPAPADNVYVHTTSIAQVTAGTEGGKVIDLSGALTTGEVIAATDVYVMKMDGDDFDGEPVTSVTVAGQTLTLGEDTTLVEGDTVFVDYYLTKKATDVHELQIDAENFAGYYYVEADTLFRDKKDGVDLPATITLPKVKIQSNFTFNMAATGDPSTFTFTMDAMPDYTKFNKARKVLCAIQVVNEGRNSSEDLVSVFPAE